MRYKRAAGIGDVSQAVTAPVMEAVQQSAISAATEQPMVHAVNKIRDLAKKQFKTDVGVAHLPNQLQENAMWIEPSAARKFVRQLDKAELSDDEKKRIRNAVGPGGLIITGKHYKRRGILEHEYGHAIASKEGGPIEKLVHKPWAVKYRDLYHAYPSRIAAILGAWKSPLRGAMYGGLTGLVTGLPTLYAEIAANRYARQLLPEEYKEEVRYMPALGTYLSGTTVPYASLGGLAGIAKWLGSKAFSQAARYVG